MPARNTKFKAATRAAPCEVCGLADGCSRGADGAHLCRKHAGPQPGWIYLGPCERDPQWAIFRREGDPCLEDDGPPRRAKQAEPDPTWHERLKIQQRAMTPQRRAELAQTLGVPEATLAVFPVGYIEQGPHLDLETGQPLGACWTFPEVDADGRVVGISCRYRGGQKKMLAGGRHGVYTPAGWRDRAGPLLLPEGASDVLALTALGLAAVGRPNNTGGVEHLVGLLQDVPRERPIVVVGEYDPKPNGAWPGRDGAVATAGKIQQQLGRPIQWVLPPDGAKDVRRWVQSRNPDPTCADEWGELGQQLLAAWAERYQAADETSATPPEGDTLIPVSIGQLAGSHPRLRAPLVYGLSRVGEVCNIIAPTKAGKSWLAYGLGLSIATGRDWFGFGTSPGRVLLIDNELHTETIAYRIPTVAAALGIAEADYRDRFDVVPLRGRLTDYAGLGPRLIDHLKPGQYRAVIIDAHYRMLPPGVSENDNAALAQVYNLIDRHAEQTGAGWFLVHHSSKGGQAEKSVTDVGAGAGSQSRAADTHLILRPHEEDGHVVLEAAVRSWPPVDPRSLRWEFPLWVPSDLDPASLKGRLTHKERRQQRLDRDGREKLLKALQKGPATTRDLRGRTGLSRERVERLVDQLEADGNVDVALTTKQGNDCRQYLLRGGVGDYDRPPAHV